MDNNILIIPEEVDLRNNNPYSIGEVFVFPENDYLLDRAPLTVTKSPKDRYLTTVEGDTLGSVSFFAWGNSKWWWIIEDVNSISETGLGPMFELPAGLTLYIPDLTKLQNSL